jgi:hypothetical protein
MTVSAAQQAAAEAAVAAGEAATQQWQQWCETVAMHVSGSDVVVDPAAPADTAVAWTGTNSEPPAVSPQPSHTAPSIRSTRGTQTRSSLTGSQSFHSPGPGSRLRTHR